MPLLFSVISVSSVANALAVICVICAICGLLLPRVWGGAIELHPALTRGAVAVASKPNAFAVLRDLRGKRFGLYLCHLRHLWIAVAVRFGRLNCTPRLHAGL